MARHTPDAERLPQLFQELMALVHRRFAGDAMAIMSAAGLTMPQIVAMHILQHGEQSVGSLTERLRLSPSATSHLVDQLVKKGFVDRREDPADRRQKRIEITAAGTDLLQRLTRAKTAEFASAVASLDPKTQRGLVAAIEAAVAELARDLPGPPCPPEKT